MTVPEPVLRSVPEPLNVVFVPLLMAPFNSNTAPEAIVNIGEAVVFCRVSVPLLTSVVPRYKLLAPSVSASPANVRPALPVRTELTVPCRRRKRH